METSVNACPLVSVIGERVSLGCCVSVGSESPMVGEGARMTLLERLRSWLRFLEGHKLWHADERSSTP